MDLHYLEYIVEIANMHSLSRAAENLYITQSTLSQYLSRLETELGMHLFERRRNEMTLTGAGRAYVAACEDILQRRKELYQQLSAMAQEHTGSFSIGITQQWGAVAYSHIIGPFRESYPQVRISVREETAVPLQQALQSGQLDMAIIPFADRSTLPSGSILLQAEELVLAIPASRTAGMSLRPSDDSMPSVEIRSLTKEPLIFSQKGTTIRQLEDQCFKDQGITPDIIMEINSHPASLIMVEQEIGTTFLPRSCVTPSDRIQYAHVSPRLLWFVVIAFRKGFTLRQSEKYFIELTRQYFSRLGSASDLT